MKQKDAKEAMMHKEPLPGSSTHEPLPSFCCQKDCIQKLDAAQMQEWNDMKAKLGNDEVNEFVYTLLKTMPQKKELATTSFSASNYARPHSFKFWGSVYPG